MYLIYYFAQSLIGDPKIIHAVSDPIIMSNIGNNFTTKSEVENYGFLSTAWQYLATPKSLHSSKLISKTKRIGI